MECGIPRGRLYEDKEKQLPRVSLPAPVNRIFQGPSNRVMTDADCDFGLDRSNMACAHTYDGGCPSLPREACR